ncbi:hypothetical protein QCA50_008891 [Cerrena zonata]|uniref:G-protein coupled receptors family 1 profile domain-containing protein n=1 Tax=Cerrena zonata TaxID=2478898 RepID=A0AAW0GDH8_9APHY
MYLPNPSAAEAWLPPDLAPWYDANKYVYAFVLGAFLWDILASLGEEYTMFRKRPFVIVNIIYIMSRILSLGTLVATFIFTAAPGLDCTIALYFSTFCGGLATPINSLLFLIRVNGVYHHSRLAMIVFTFLWLSTCTAMMGPWTSKGSIIEHTSFCVVSHTHKYSGVVFFLLTIFDTIVFLAITLRVISISLSNSRSSWLKAFSKGKGMGKLSKALLQTGQLYYLVTVGVNMATMIVLWGFIGPSPFHQMLPVITIVLQNAMACKVFRLLKLGLIHETQPSLGEVTSAYFGHLSSQATTAVGDSTGMANVGKEVVVSAREEAVPQSIHIHGS